MLCMASKIHPSLAALFIFGLSFLLPLGHDLSELLGRMCSRSSARLGHLAVGCLAAKNWYLWRPIARVMLSDMYTTRSLTCDFHFFRRAREQLASGA